jgi:hypothetical protein
MRHLGTRRVPFTGSRDVEEHATWGQLLVWRDMAGMAPGTPYNETNGTLVPAGTTVADVLDALGALVSRHEALRTLFAEDPAGSLRQHVTASGQVRVDEYQVDDDGPAGVARFVAEVEPVLRGTAFATATRPPFRAAVAVGPAGALAVLVGVAKLAVDLQGSRLVVRDLTALLEARAQGRDWPTADSPTQPVDLARTERSPRGAAMTERAVRHAVTQVSRFPARVFAAPAAEESDGPRFWRGGLVSTALPQAVALLSDRWQVSGTTLLMTASAAVLAAEAARADGAVLPWFGWQLIVGNRIGPELRQLAVTATQDLPLAIDLRGERFSAVARSAGTAALRAYRHGRFDPGAVDAEIRSSGGVGEGRDLACYFNDTRDPLARPSAAALDPDRILAEVESSLFRWEEKTDWDAVTVFFEVFDVRERPDALRLSLYADVLRLPIDRIPVVLKGVERLLVTAAAAGDVPMADLADLCLGPGERGLVPAEPGVGSSWRIALKRAGTE